MAQALGSYIGNFLCFFLGSGKKNRNPWKLFVLFFGTNARDRISSPSASNRKRKRCSQSARHARNGWAPVSESDAKFWADEAGFEIIKGSPEERTCMIDAIMNALRFKGIFLSPDLIAHGVLRRQASKCLK